MVKLKKIPKAMKIILVDREGDPASRLSRMFQRADAKVDATKDLAYEVTRVRSAVDAFMVYQAIHPDLMIVSIEDDGLESKQLCRNIREQETNRHTGIIFLASKPGLSDEHAVSFLECGADDVFRFESSDREILARTNAVLKLKAMTDELRSANHRLHQLSYTDELTGLANMRAFNGRYSKAVTECFAGRVGLGVIMLDLDNFKQINDTTNHLMGSHVIAEVGKLIKNAGFLVETDCAARFGGDEYVIFLHDTSLESVTSKADDLRRLVANAYFVKDGRSVSITTSIGVAWAPPGYKGKAEDPIKAADLMLYRSKHNGRNRVSSYALVSASELNALADSENALLQSTKTPQSA